MKLDSLRNLWIHNLQDLYSAETQITAALPKMAERATDPKLRTAFESHLKETQKQLERLDKIGKELGEKMEGETCKAMQGLVREAESFLKENTTPEVCDAGMAAMAQKVEHYEIAGYGTALCWARELGEEKIALLLEETLTEEKNADQKLTDIAESRLNVKAE